MPTVVGLTFEDGSGLHFYTPGTVFLVTGDVAVVETDAGMQLATVAFGPKDVASFPVPLRPVVRLATEADLTQAAKNRDVVARARVVTPEKIEMLGLPMKLVDITADFDGARITVFFAAEGRIDFRELVRELVSALGVRVLMHQVGARDHAKMLGGIGSCGRVLCCSTWMHIFEPVSMKMAKEQSLFLNPSKFSGNCGKLKCCLRYEYDFYSEIHDAAPVVGAECETPQGRGRVAEINPVKGCYFVDVPRIGRVEMKLRLVAVPVGCGHAPDAGCGAEDDAPGSDCAGCALAGTGGPGCAGCSRA